MTNAPIDTHPPVTTLAAATLSITLGALPVFLLGALAVFIRDELRFGELQLGATASLYYLSSALTSVPGGWVTERLGAWRGIALAAGISVLSMGGVALAATSWPRLVGFMMLAGLANGVALPATNLALVRGIPSWRQGVAFGLKQSSGAFATLLAGAAVPVLGLTVGWRWAFALAAAIAVPLVVAGLRSASARERLHRRRGAVPVRPLWLLSAAAAAAVVAGSSLGAFFVESAVANGIAPGLAGTILALGSVLGIAARVGWGWVGDHREGGHLQLVSALLIFGAVGFALLGVANSALIVLATLVVFTAGWAWPGLFNFAVVRCTPAAPAVASGITGAGQFGGGIVGPLGFGALVERTSYSTAWLAAAMSLVLAGVLILVASSWLDRVAAPAA